MKTFHRRRLPHWHPPGGAFFITFRLKDSLPMAVLDELKTAWQSYQKALKMLKERGDGTDKARIAQLFPAYFERYDSYLDRANTGEAYLTEPPVAKKIMDKFAEYDGKHFKLLALTIMPNHVHCVFDTAIQLAQLGRYEEPTEENYVSVSRAMQLIKGGSSYDINRLRGGKGSIWHPESFDRWVRNDQELMHFICYTINNPIKARLAKDWRDWPFTYIDPSVAQNLVCG